PSLPGSPLQSLTTSVLDRSEFKDKAIPALKAALDDPEESVRLKAAGILAHLDAEIPAVLPILVEELRSHDYFTRQTVGQILESLGPRAKHALTELRAMLKDRDPLLRRAAARILARLEPQQSDQFVPV